MRMKLAMFIISLHVAIAGVVAMGSTDVEQAIYSAIGALTMSSWLFCSVGIQPDIAAIMQTVLNIGLVLAIYQYYLFLKTPTQA